MKTKLTPLIAASVVIATFCLAQSADRSNKSDAISAATVREIRSDLDKTQNDLKQALARIAALERQVGSQQQAILKLQETRDVRKFTPPSDGRRPTPPFDEVRPTPLEHK